MPSKVAQSKHAQLRLVLHDLVPTIKVADPVCSGQQDRIHTLQQHNDSFRPQNVSP